MSHKPRADDRSPPFRIRRMALEDLDAVVALQEASFSNPWSPELLRRELTHEWSTILVAEGAELYGFVIFWLVHDELHILNIATAPEHRKRGVARALLEETLRRAQAHGCSLATLEVRRSNEPALGLYRSFGFRAVGIRPNYYVDDREDAVVMVREL